MRKRIISLILAVCMLMSLLPSVALAAETQPGEVAVSDYTLTYDLTKVDKPAGTALTEITDMSLAKGFWAYHSAKKDTSTTQAKYLYLNTAKNEWVALKIYVPVPGKYSTSMVRYAYNRCGIGDIYILPGNTADVEAALAGADAQKIGDSIDYSVYPSSGNNIEEELLPAEFTSAGEYLLVFRCTAKGSLGSRMYPKSITFTGSSSTPALQSVFAKDIELPKGESAYISVEAAYMSDYSAATGYTLTYESSDPSVATVDENTGLVTAIKSEDTTVTVTATKDGVSVTDTVNVNVLPEGYTGYKINYDLTAAAGFESATYQETYNFWEYKAGDETSKSIEINVPVAGKYEIRPDGNFAGTVKIGTTPVGNGETYTFPSAGKYEVIFEDDGTYPETLTLYSGEKGYFMGVEMSYNPESKIASVGKGIFSDGSKYSLDGADVKYSVEDFSVASVGETTGKVLPGNHDGELSTKLYADVTLGGVTARGAVDVNIKGVVAKAPGVATTFTFDTAGDSWKNANSNYFDPVDNRVEEWYINGITYNDSDGNWEWYEGDWSWSYGLDMRPLGYYLTAGCIQLSFKKNGWAAFKVKIPEPGRYWVSTTGWRRNLSSLGVGKMYFIPVSKTKAEIESALTDTNLAGSVDYFDERYDKQINVTDELGAVDIPVKGEYLLVIRDSGAGLDSRPKSVTLNGMNKLKFIDFTLPQSEIDVGASIEADYAARLLDGTLLKKGEATFTFSSDDETVATFEDGVITGVGDGTTTVTVTAVNGVESVSASKTITVNETNPPEKIILDCVDTSYVGKETELATRLVYSVSGNKKKLDNAKVTYSVDTADSGKASVNGNILLASEPGDVTVWASYTHPGYPEFTASATVTVLEGTDKSGSTYYTTERVAEAQKNIKDYSWAKSTQKSAVNNADKYIQNFDTIYSFITSNSVPRSYLMGLKSDPYYKNCRWCGENIAEKYGTVNGGSVYDVDIYGKPWKAECPACERLFPSNDFESFYELGLAKDGTFDRMRALEAHRAMLLEKGASLPATLDGVDGSDAWYAYYGYGNPDGYLYNKEYPELYTAGETLNGIDPFYYNADLDGDGTADHDEVEIDGIMWGVDDSMGYDTRRINANGVPEVHTWVSYINHTSINQPRYAINWLSYAYVYTGDAKYGRYGAILLDRIADFYPDWHIYNNETREGYYFYWQTRYPDVDAGDAVFATNGGGGPDGKIWGRITDCEYTRQFLMAADAFYPLLEKRDESLVNTLTKKAKEFGTDDVNPKTTADHIWQNWRDNLLLESFKAVKDGDVYGNMGMHQSVSAMVALVLDSEPQSSDIVEWIFKSGEVLDELSTGTYNTYELTGGNMDALLTDSIDRDGMGYEGSPTYNAGWVVNFYGCADALKMYTGDTKYDMYQNPKFAKMFMSCIPVTTVDTHVAAIADSTAPAALAYADNLDTLIVGFKNYKDNPYMANALAEYIYRRNGYTVEGLNYGIFESDPEAIQDDILELIDDDLQPPSEMVAGYGFSILRDGATYGDKNTPTYTNNMRDFWLTYGYANGSHAHYDKLNLGIEAYGLNMAPDFGYPEKSTTDPNRHQWVRPTINHNTVTVNEKNQILGGISYPKHFDDSGDVKVMDVDASGSYDETSIYRRTVVMINAGPDVSYGVDFFRVKGGTDHIYSFHSQSEKIGETEGLTLTAQSGGTYAGENVAFGEDPSHTHLVAQFHYPPGYTWMKNVRRANNVGEFAVDFEVTDYNRAIKDSKDLHMRLTMLNDFPMSEVALTSGYVTRKTNTQKLPETFEYVLARRKSTSNLDSLFTAVYEPYKGDRYISDMAQITDVVADDTSKLRGDDVVKVVKVIRKADDGSAGRVDYIVYATNNEVTYTVTDDDFSFQFRGFVGVLSLDKEGGEVIYRYVNDGDILRTAGETEQFNYKAYTGKVSDFTRDKYSFNSSITVKFDVVEKAEELAGKYVYISNDAVHNAVYKIENVTPTENENEYSLGIGITSLVRSYKDAANVDKGVNYNIGKGQSVTIPISNIEDNGPEFGKVNNLTATAGNSVSVNLAQYRTDNNGEAVTYSATSGTDIPRGASLNGTTGKITWKPDDSQIGTHSFKIAVRDESGRETVINFVVTVYGGTTGSSGTEDTDSSGEDSNTEESSGGGGGGGGAPLPDEGETDDGNTDAENRGEEGDESGDNTGTGTEDGSLRFIDLGSHAWAADAINALAEAGIIKGTSENKYSPANNITRADYAILLVRAFNQTSDNTENFDDVLDTDYFAHELAIARNTGIVGGIGNNLFAPRKNIMRQDMMLMTYRALKALGIELTVGEVDAPDLDKVDEYALDAVRALISNGLVNGKNGYIDASAYTTRAEVAVLLCRILDFMATKTES